MDKSMLLTIDKYFLSLLFVGCLFFNFDLCVDPIRETWYYFLIVTSIFLIYKSTYNARYKAFVVFDKLSILLLVFSGYFFCRMYFSISDTNLMICSVFVILLLYFFFRSMRQQNILFIESAIILSCLSQAAWGLLQLFWFSDNVYPIYGSFDNPAGFAMCVVIGLPYLLYLKMPATKLLRIGKYIAVLIICGAVILSDSRTGIIVVLFIVIMYLKDYYKIRIKKSSKIVMISAVILVLSLLFLYKENSAIGRLFIWVGTCNIIMHHPYLGGGSQSFIYEYMPNQALIFENSSYATSFAQIADNVASPFNEYIRLTTEYGFVGLLLLVIIIVYIFKHAKNRDPDVICIISIGIFAGFSYPFRYPFIFIIIAYILSRISINLMVVNKRHLQKHLLSRYFYPIIAGIIFCALLSSSELYFDLKWKNLTTVIPTRNNTKFLDQYKFLYSKKSNYPFFVYNYGAILNHIKDFKNSCDVLHRCETIYNDYNVQILLADNYYKMEDFIHAEKHYIKASNMCPNRFIPLYFLMEIYQKQGCPDKAILIAKILTNKSIKVPSGEIYMIITRAKSVLENLDNTSKEESDEFTALPLHWSQSK